MLDSVHDGTHNMSRKAGCKRGHELTGPNLGSNGRGARRCKACGIAHGRVRQHGGDLQRIADAVYAALVAG